MDPSLHHYFSCDFKFMFWNCRGATGKKHEIEKLAEKLDIMFLFESCVPHSSQYDIRVIDFQSIKLSSTTGVRGVIALIRTL